MPQKPWFEYITITELGNARLAEKEAMQGGLSLKALHEGGTIYTGSYSQAVKNYKDIDQIVSLAQSLGAKPFSIEIPTTDDETYVDSALVWHDGFISLFATSQGYLRVNVSHFDKTIVDKVLELANTFTSPKKGSQGKCFMLGSTQSGLQFMQVGMAGIDFEPENYTDNFVETYNHIVEDLKNKEPCGRIIIMSSVEPGMGKSFAIRSLMNSVPEGLFCVIPAHMMSALTNPELIPLLINTKKQNKDVPIIIIAEDADQILSCRGADNISGISTLLNLGDGILGAMIDVRVIATTNIDVGAIDPAVRRDGRLCRHIELLPLHIDHANKVYRRLTQKDEPIFKDKNVRYSLATVYRAAKAGGWTPPAKSRAVGFNLDSEETPEVITSGESGTEFFLEISDASDALLKALESKDFLEWE
jgi:hypothetical protein